MKSRVVAYLSLALLVLEVVLVFVSWLLSATMTAGVRSLLSAEGIRWLLGHFVDILLSPVLVWLLLLAMAWGCLQRSRLLGAIIHRDSYSQRFALRATIALAIIYIGVVLWLSVVPHAVLLSATGGLWPSPFSRAFIPLLSLGIILMSISYGVLSRSFSSLSQVTDSMASGIASAAPLFLLYVLLMQLIESIRFVF